MIAAKLDLLIKKMEQGSKQLIHAPVYAMGSHFKCKICGNDGHSENDCPKTREDCAYLSNNNRHHPQQGAKGGTSHVHHSREVIIIILLSIRISIRTDLP